MMMMTIMSAEGFSCWYPKGGGVCCFGSFFLSVRFDLISILKHLARIILSTRRQYTMAARAPESPFERDLKDLHLVYDYNVPDAQGKRERWRYEIWFFSEVRL